MKNFLNLLVFAMITFPSFSQDFDKNKILSIITAPGAYDDGFNLGAQFEYTNRTIYVGPELFVFPNLHGNPNVEGMDYYHLIGRFGLNEYFGKISHIFRLYAGTRAGALLRDGYIGALLGLEAGFSVILADSIFIGGSITSDTKTDSTVYSNDPKHTVNSVFIVVGINF